MTDGACLSEEVLLAYVGGSLAPDERRHVERHGAGCTTCRELLAAAASAMLTTAASPGAAPGAAPGAFGATSRYRIERQLGAGGMGVVYQAWDHERGEEVALKALKRVDPATLFLFKQEFRALADIAHPNLVALHELHTADDGQWFFAMELVDGSGLGEFLAGARERLAEVFLQAARGLGALHDGGKLHRDIKPSNVLVTREGRVVIVDFGLATDYRRRLFEARLSSGLVGTPAYMSPEQVAGEPLTTASDWYGFGVMLFQALTGALPFSGSALEMARARLSADGPAPSTVAVDVPRALDELCAKLLRRDPAARAGAAEIFAVLASAAGPDERGENVAISDGAQAGLTGATGAAARGPFVGRAAELAQLAAARDEVRAGRPVIVHVHGASGIGKTALVQRFLDELQEREPAVVIEGRCYERESVPYKAVDSVVDQLVQYLLTLGADGCAALLPPDVALLAELFPVLERVQAIRDAPVPSGALRDAPERRRRAFSALAELLGRIAREALVAIAIDDLQWGDLDSAAFFSELAAPGGPPLLLLVTYRRGSVESSPLLRLLKREDVGARVRELAVEPLPGEDAERLAAALLAGADAAAVARESHGSPLFVHELSRWASAGGRLAGARLEEMVVQRLGALPPEVARLLEVIAVAGHPVRLGVASGAVDGALPLHRSFGALRAAHLVVTRGTGDAAEVEPYHDRIRDVIVARLGDGAAGVHGRLARSLESRGDADPQQVLEHYLGAGEPERARPHAVRAAAAAARSLAFERAAELYGVAARLTDGNEERAELLAARAAALADAGRGGDAGKGYLEAARLREAALGRDRRVRALDRLAAEQFLRGGRFDEGVAILRRVLGGIGVGYPRSNAGALIALLGRRARLAFRGLDFRRSARVDDAALERLEACWAGVVGLSLVDPLRSANFQTLYLRLALDAGEPELLVRGLGVEAVYLSSIGGAARVARARRIEATVRELAAAGDPYLRAYAEFVSGTIAFFAGDWRAAAKSCEEAARHFRADCTGAAWEMGTNLGFAQAALAYLGRLDELGRRAPEALRDSDARGDVFASTTLRVGMNTMGALAADRPDEARARAAEAKAAWTSAAYHAQHYMHLLATAQTDLYAGDARAAFERVTAEWPRLTRAQLLRLQYVRVEAHHLRGRCALAFAIASPPPARARLIALAARDAEKLSRERFSCAPAFSAALRAGVAAARGEDPVEELTRAADAFSACGMALYADCARRRLGAPAADVATLKNPPAMWRMLLPGFTE